MNNCPIHSIHKAILNVAYKSEASFFMEKKLSNSTQCYQMLYVVTCVRLIVSISYENLALNLR